jgi:aspartate racemase
MLGILGITSPACLYFLKFLHEFLSELSPNSHPSAQPLYLLRMENTREYQSSIADLQEVWPVLMGKAISELMDSGATRVVCPANSNHAVYARVAESTGGVWLHIADPVLEVINALGIKKVLVLGTSMTASADVYGSRYASHGVSVVYPEAKLQEQLHQAIVMELINDQVGVRTREVISELQQHAGQSCDGIVLGCTELLMVQEDLEKLGLPVIDSCRELARASAECIRRQVFCQG